MRLSVRLPLALGAVLVVGATAAGISIARSAEGSLRDAVVENDRHSAVAYAGALSSHLAGAEALVRLGASSPFVAEYLQTRGPSAPRSGLRARSVADRMLDASRAFDHVMLLRPDGTVLLVQPRVREASLSTKSVGFLRWVREVAAGGHTVVSDLHISPTTQSPSVVVAAAVRDASGQLIGIWAGALDLSVFSAVALVPPAEGVVDGSYGFVTDPRGLIVAHHHRPDFVTFQTDFRSVPAVTAALAGRSGAGEWFNPVDQEAELGAYLPLGTTGWAVVYSTRKDLALAPARALARTIAGYALGGTLGGTLVLVVSGHLLIRRSLRPLHRLSEASRGLARGFGPAGGGTTRNDEVGDLATAFDRMQIRLADRDAALREHARHLEEANAELEAFSYSVSHDLRTPLRAIEGFGTILQEEYASTLDPQASELLGRVRAAAGRMGVLIDDLVELSRVSRAELRCEDVDVSAQCAESLRELASADPERVVTVEIEPGLVLNGDRRLLRTVVDNLLSNAWKFTGKTLEPRIEVRALPGPQGQGVCVRDNGVGFSMADTGKLFGAFQRLDSAGDFPGNGIGLATVQRVVRRHGGELLAWSEPGQGASFTVTLGPAPPPTVTARKTPEGDHHDNDSDPARRRQRG